MPDYHPSFLKPLIPKIGSANATERLRASIGALIGILVTGFVTQYALGSSAAVPLLIAPMGASSVLLFAVPASPLAQPWSVLGGNLIASIAGVTAALWIEDPFIASAVAVGAAIALMMACKCIHPPSGAVALTAVLGGPAVHAAGYGFVLWPVGVNTILLLLTAFIYNNFTGRRYPHKPVAAPNVHATGDVPPSARVGLTQADLTAVLEEHNQLFDVNPEDIAGLVREAELKAYRRRSSEITCDDIMSRDIIGVAPSTTLKQAHDLLRAHHIKALPVTAEDATVLGIVTQTDLLDKAAWGASGPRISNGHRLRKAIGMEKAPQGTVADIMTVEVRSVRPETPIADIVPLMADGGLHHMPVVDADNKLVGLVTQSDLIAGLFQGLKK
ncbi:membrane protein [Terrihabitans soli]|uniref:Membrane protein n=1 Tax=Terrihabitans soli TaxID=708113 RepID=A0A6S6QRT9_9HYPH|nr:HPP family protein [Terrihabitans soli]BCJ89751.1 membrane protein [Terrihabitans soli]